MKKIFGKWSKVLGAMCIVIAMVLMALTGFVYARSSDVSVSPGAGTRGETFKMVSIRDGIEREVTVDENGNLIETNTDTETNTITEEETSMTALSTASYNPEFQEITTDDGTAVAQMIRKIELLDNPTGEVTYRSEHGSITIRPSEGTRAGEIDANGPYGGPNCFEGSCTVHFQVTVYDPSIIMFRWDFNNDGVFDYPDQTGYGLLGNWITDTEFDYTFYDDFYNDIVVEGWDGISTYIVINTGDNLGESTSWNWSLGMFGATYRFVGMHFKAKRDITVTELGFYKYSSDLVYKMYLWEFGATGNRLGMCDPPKVNFQWNWCTLPTPADIYINSEYWVAIRIESSFRGFSMPADTDYVDFIDTYGSFCYLADPDDCRHSFMWSSSFIPTVDFRWREVLILPDTVSDTSFLEVINVAPRVWGIRTDPTIGLEGNPMKFYATFEDPGLDDDWEFRWIFPGGVAGPWMPVSKMAGGAKVLYLHAQTDVFAEVSSGLIAACGIYCVKLDFLDWGPLGTNTVPPLSLLKQYDVVFVGGRYGPIPSSTGMGDLLADYMDAGGNVIIDHVSMFSSSTWGIGGRWQTDGYSPVDQGSEVYDTSSLGTIYVPGHPILDGVTTWGGTYKISLYDVKTGAIRVADWGSGRVAIATNTNPIVPNNARAVYLDVVPFMGFNTGDFWRIMANAIRFAAGNPDPWVKEQPFELDAFEWIIPDDDPTTTTPIDPVPVSVEVKDDDHGKILITSETDIYFQDFNNFPSECYYYMTWPPGWSADPYTSWYCQYFTQLGSYGAGTYYYYNYYGTSTLTSPSYDLSAYQGGKLEFFMAWQANYQYGSEDGYLEASIDGGATFPILLYELHTNDPPQFTGDFEVLSSEIGGQSNVVFRFRFVDDYGLGYWMFDDFTVVGLEGDIVQGLGTASDTAWISNVPPTVVGGFDEAFRVEAQSLVFDGYTITDPALMEPTEWFAYSWNMGDGTPTQWMYKGTMTAPSFKVLYVHSQYSPYIGSMIGMLESLDVVESVTDHNMYATMSSPTLSTMMQYDMIMLGFDYAAIGYEPWDIARRQFGDNLASYLEAGRGGFVSFFGPYTDDPYGRGPIWDLFGRFRDWDYGPYERETFVWSASQLGPIYEPGHEVMTNVRSGQVQMAFIHFGDNQVTIGGQGIAAGRDGLNLADTQDLMRGVGVKELNNGVRVVAIGAYAGPNGADMPVLTRNAIGWASGGIPTPKLDPFTYNYGDNGVYRATLEVIDDDMGWVWDPIGNRPVQALPDATIITRYVTVTVDNVDPLINPESIEAFIATTTCLRVSGTDGNTVSVNVQMDGSTVLTASVTRRSGDPNPYTERCGMFKLDVLEPHAVKAKLTYSAPSGGSNPTWLIFNPWRDPVTPGHGTVTIKYDFDKNGQTINQPLPTLKRDLLAGGKGAKIDFIAEAYDPGTDDLAFFWQWGGVTGTPYVVPNQPTSAYTIHIHHNNGKARTDGTLADPQYLGYSEPYFDRPTNIVTSPLGSMHYRARDTAVHAFDMKQDIYYVVLIVLDDDNGRGYDSPFGTDGIDMEFIFLDLS